MQLRDAVGADPEDNIAEQMLGGTENWVEGEPYVSDVPFEEI